MSLSLLPTSNMSSTSKLFKKMMGEIKSQEVKTVITRISNQYCLSGDYDPINAYDYDYDTDEDFFEDKNDPNPWGYGQNGEQWSSDI